MKAIKRTLHTISPLSLREIDGEESRIITGYAILFDTPSAMLFESDGVKYYEKIAPSAITRQLLDESDIKMTMFHDNHLILARSKKGEGTLKYDIDERGVSFEFEAPKTIDGDKAIELVKRGDISGCSFAFTTHYYNRDYVEKEFSSNGDDKTLTHIVRVITGIYDFTLTTDPAYPDTECSVEERELFGIPENSTNERAVHQVNEMRKKANINLLNI